MFNLQAAADTISLVIESMGIWFFCTVVVLYILPTIIDRLIFYIPHMLRLYRRGEVYFRGSVWSALEILLWLAVLGLVYGGLYWLDRPLLWRMLWSIPALLGWLLGVVYTIFRIRNFESLVKREFYYAAYMRHIRPEALKRYQDFLAELDDLDESELWALLRQEGLPYMHRQAALRRLRRLKES